MKLMKMRALPRRAGLANLHFNYDDPFGLPIRKDTEIVLPLNPHAKFYSLQNGRQFLFVSATEPAQCWFGGTDEKPFLVRMREPALATFRDSGENGFYDSLRPRIVHDLEKDLGVAVKRQGDIFAVALLLNARSMEIFGHLLNLHWKDADDFSVFGTRHRIGGQVSNVAVRGGLHLLATGVLEAPDHTPLRLEGTHLLAQADNLYNAPMAD